MNRWIVILVGTILNVLETVAVAIVLALTTRSPEWTLVLWGVFIGFRLAQTWQSSFQEIRIHD